MRAICSSVWLLGGEIARGALEEEAELQQLGATRRLARELPERFLEQTRRERRDDGSARVAGARLDETGRLQHAQGFAHGRAADREVLHEAPFAGEAVAGLQLAGVDRGLDCSTIPSYAR